MIVHLPPDITIKYRHYDKGTDCQNDDKEP